MLIYVQLVIFCFSVDATQVVETLRLITRPCSLLSWVGVWAKLVTEWLQMKSLVQDGSTCNRDELPVVQSETHCLSLLMSVAHPARQRQPFYAVFKLSTGCSFTFMPIFRFYL